MRIAAVALLLPAAAAAAAAPAGWHGNLADGLVAAKRSGKPLLVVTAWSDRQCDTCAAWRRHVQKDPGVVAAAERFERVEWLYDGFGGKVITWTKENGNTSDDPAVLVHLVGADGKATSTCPAGDVHDAKSFARWLRERAAEWEKAHPRSRIPFVPAEIELVGSGEERRAHCHALGVAREMRTPAAVYVGREEREGDDAKALAEAAAARKFEKETLGSAEAAKAAEGWTLLRVDRSTVEGALLAKSLGVEAAPAVVLLPAGAEKGIVLDARTSAGSLAYQWKKASAPPPPPAPPPAK